MTEPPGVTDATDREREVCEVCARPYAVWFAPSVTWNAVMRGGDRSAADRIAFICPTCFTLDAEAQGIRPTAWMVVEEILGEPRSEMLRRAEMRWMSVEDSTIEVSARELALLGRALEAAEADARQLRAALEQVADHQLNPQFPSGHDARREMQAIARAALGRA